MPFNLGSFAPLEGLLQSDKLLQQRQYNEILKQQAQQQLQKQQQDQSALGLVGRSLPQIPQMDPQMGIPQQGIGGQPVPPPQQGAGVMGQLYGQNQAGVAPGDPGAVKASWFGNAPGWRDPSDSGLQAGGQPVSAGPGIALPNRGTLGQQFDVTDTNTGKQMTLPQTDIGPAKWTGRGVDINAPAAQAFGYTPQNFPTDSQFVVRAHRQLDVQLDQNGGKMIQAGIPGPAVQDTTKTAMNAGRELNPMEWGRLTQKQIIDAIEKVGPNETDQVKALAFMQLNKIMAPQEKLAAQMWAKQNQDEILNKFRQENLDERRRVDDERIRSDRAREERLAGGGGGASGTGLMAGKQYEYTDKDGNPQTVVLRENRNKAGYIDTTTSQPWTLPEGAKNFKPVTASTAGGGRAGSQLGRQVIGAAEVGVDLQNVSNMPVGTTIGPTGDVEPGKTISSALKADFARTVLTDEDEINMKIAMGGLGRELSILMQPVGGGRWSSEQLEPLIPRSGYTLGNSIMALARIRQAADNAIDGFTRSPIVGQEQKAFALEKKKEMEKAIPWTVNDALAYMRRGDPKETFLDFVKKEHIGGGAERGGGAAGSRSSSLPDIQTLQQQLQPENWSKLSPEQQADVARQVEEIEKAGGARGN